MSSPPRQAPTTLPVSMRIPADLQRDIIAAAAKADRTFTSMVVSILRRWQQAERR